MMNSLKNQERIWKNMHVNTKAKILMMWLMVCLKGYDNLNKNIAKQ